jgi:hypothetical protein
MAEVIDLRVERAMRTSGIKDRTLLQDIIDQGYNPNDPIELNNYYNWKTFENFMETDDVAHNWTEEAIDRLLTDIKEWDPTQPYTVTVEGVEFDTDYELFLNTDEEKG